jgi:hypothetical protein
VRTFQPGDEGSIVELSNHSLAPYAGWARRTVDYWRWNILARPGVHATDILLLQSDDKLVGYAALHESGVVLEFFVDPEQRFRKRRAFVKQLVSTLEGRARAHACDRLIFSLPATDKVTDKTLRAAGYVLEQGRFFSLGILNPKTLLRELLTARRSSIPSMRLQSFIFELTPGQYPFLLTRRLLVRLGSGIRVDDIVGEEGDPTDCVIRLDLCALTELIFCRVSVNSLLNRAQLEITPASSLGDARSLLNALIIDSTWHVPRSDSF